MEQSKGLQKNTGKKIKFLIILNIILIYVILFFQFEKQLTPRPDELKYTNFISSKIQDNNYEIKIIKIGDKKYIEAQPVWSQLKKMGCMILLRSGPPSYIFNSNGNMMDWSTDMYGDARYLKKWANYKDSEVSNIKDSIKFIEENKSETN